MADIQIILSRDVYLDSLVTPVTMADPLFAGDASAQRIRFRCFQRHGNPAPLDLSGTTITAHFIRPDEGDVVITGVGGSEWSYVDLPQACYVYRGVFKLLIRAVSDDVTTSILYLTGRIEKATTDTIIDPGHIIPSLEELLAQIDACEEATDAANTAAASATAAAASGVRTDTDAQGLTATQQANARTNIAAASALEHADLQTAFDTVAGADIPWEIGTTGNGQKWDSGATTANTLVDTTKYVDVQGFQVLRYLAFASNSASTLIGMAFFTGKTVGSYLSGVQGYSGNDSGRMLEQVALVPEGAKYARFTVRKDCETFFIKGYRSIEAYMADAKDQVLEILSGGTESTPLTGGTWELGAVSESGIDTTSTTQAHSAPISIEDFDQLNVDLTATDLSYWVTVYKYDGTNYSKTEFKNVWIKRGGASFEDKTVQYVIVVRNNAGTDITVADAQAAVAITGMKTTPDVFTSARTAAKGETLETVVPVTWSATSIDSSAGYANSNKNISTLPISILDHDALRVELVDDAYRYAVYSYDGTTFANASGGWSTAPTDYADKALRYAVRVQRADNANIDPAAYADACAAVAIKRVIYGADAVKGYGYDRSYADITHSLSFERKAISASGITDSTVSLLAKLPNAGSVEVRLNRPVGKFSVWKVTGGTPASMTDGWTYYQYRYTGEPDAEYYVAVATPTDAEIPLTSFNIVSVFTYTDVGVQLSRATSLGGKSIAVFGDSIVQGRMCKNGNSVNMAMAKPFSNLLSEIAGTEPNNFGIGGALVYDNDWKSLSRHYASVTGFDVVFLCAGTNDYGGAIDMADFRAAFTTVLTALVAGNTKVYVCTPTRRSTNGTNSAGLMLQDYATAEIEIAQAQGVSVIDLYTLTNNQTFKGQLSGGLHPNEIGARIIADLILDAVQ